MTTCSEIAVKDTTSDKILLKGIITGLSSSKQYCLLYMAGGGFTNLPNGSYGYTYFTSRSSFDLDGAGCYVPVSDIPASKWFYVRLYEVSGSCENIVEILCIKELKYEGITTSLKNIPPEIVAVMPSGTTKIIAFKLAPIVFFGRDISSISRTKSGISGVSSSIASFLTMYGYSGWKCLGADVVELANGDVMAVIFLEEV